MASNSPYVNTYDPSKPLDFGVIGNNSAGTKTGASAIMDVGVDSINGAANKINDILAKYDPTNPAQMLQAQVALNNYNLALTVTSAMIKSIEDTAKAVAHNIS